MYKELMEINEKNINIEKLTNSHMVKYSSPINIWRCLSPGTIKDMQIKIRYNLLLSDYQTIKWVTTKTANDEI